MLKFILWGEALGFLIALAGAGITKFESLVDTGVILIAGGMGVTILSFVIDIRYHARRRPRLLQKDRAA